MEEKGKSRCLHFIYQYITLFLDLAENNLT